VHVVTARPGHAVIKIVPESCGRQVCKKCRPIIGLQCAESVTRRLSELQRHHRCEGDMQMWTLTHRQDEGTPEAAYDEVRESRAISRTMAKMGITYWVLVVEWHESGWPHYHVITWEPVRTAYHKKAEVDGWWGRGLTEFETGRNARGYRTSPMEAGIRYLMGYFVDLKHDVPDWLLDRSHVRLISGSRPWGAIRGSAEGPEPDPAADDDPAETEPRTCITNREALADCRGRAVIIREWCSTEGVVCKDFMGKVRLPYRVVRKAVERILEGTADINRASAAFFEDNSLWRRLQTCLPMVE